jgi:hypothetical protein
MRLLKITNELSVICESVGTRTGFRHEAILMRNGYQVLKDKCCYINRTWECYQFDSVLEKLLEHAKKEKFLKV